MTDQHGDFTDFYAAAYGRVVALVAAMTGDRAQAEDIAQEAFARALTRWPRIASYDLPEAWVRRVAVRLVTDASRRWRRSLRHLPGLARAERQPPDVLASNELSAALLKLPLPQRQAIVLHYLIDRPADEIARDLGIPVSTVRSRLAAGRRRLEHELTADSQEVPGDR